MNARFKSTLRNLPPFILSAVVTAAIAYLTLWPDPLPDAEKLHLFEGADKVVHFLMMAGLTLALAFDYLRRDCRRTVTATTVAVLICGVAAFGAFDEWLQSAMQMGRTGSLGDLAADIAGAAVAAFGSLGLNRFNKC